MAQTLFANAASLSLPLLDANFTDLYGYAKNIVSDGSGNVLLAGKTSVSLSEAGAYFEPSLIGYGRLNFVKASSSGTGANTAVAFYYAGTSVGYISYSSTATAYNTTSDRRLKRDIKPAGDAGALIDSIQVVSHGWLADPAVAVRFGFIAQDLAVVMPEAVARGDEGPEVQQAWAVDKSALVPLLVAEVQALRRRIAALEAAA